MTEPTSSTLTVADVASRVLQRPLLAVVPAVAGLVLGIFYVLFAPATYIAIASVQVLPLVADSGAVKIQDVINMPTEQQVARSSSVRALAADAMGTSPEMISAGLSVDFPQDTQVINIRFTSSSPAKAATAAQTVAESYLKYRGDSAHQEAQARIDEINNQITEVQQALEQDPGTKTGALQENLKALMSDRRAWSALKETAGGRVITKAAIPTAPTSPKAKVHIPLGLVVGVISGLTLAVLMPTSGRRTAVTLHPATPRRAREAKPSRAASEFDQMISQTISASDESWPSRTDSARSTRVSSGSADANAG
ncbi:MAG: hypothetical protein QG608_1168 [Actinomycetota bacterium]|nr:hypothetical protein [Actinomycetota bacterium]